MKSLRATPRSIVFNYECTNAIRIRSRGFKLTWHCCLTKDQESTAGSIKKVANWLTLLTATLYQKYLKEKKDDKNGNGHSEDVMIVEKNNGKDRNESIKGQRVTEYIALIYINAAIAIWLHFMVTVLVYALLFFYFCVC